MALQHIGFQFPDPVRAMLDADVRRTLTETAEHALAPISEAARHLLMDSVNAHALASLARLLVERGTVRSLTVIDGDPALVFESEVRGEDALRAILDAGVRAMPLDE
jgi:hypothetical protein